ncbi:hypothetical protein C8R41DRAFT_99383 [Lentinula lateritia]|uniref:Secreted protein n=1 Tax=Lentinula lateritia TaxID=40482 RepID=A0ABQ8UXU5_9AGAR|nr:hypothetical protein C8R41DRAFT_99383 [Lentinula lateritia]
MRIFSLLHFLPEFLVACSSSFVSSSPDIFILYKYGHMYVPRTYCNNLQYIPLFESDFLSVTQTNVSSTNCPSSYSGRS